MDDFKPFIELTTPRSVPAWLPQVLRDFYSRHEGVGLDASADFSVRLCKLSEVKKIAWKDLHVVGSNPPAGGWQSFRAIRVGIGAFFDELLYILRAPVAPEGSIMAFGASDVAGPGGIGPDRFLSSLVLALDFDSWIERLREDKWDEYGLAPGGISDLPQTRQRQVRRHFLALNPAITWGAE